MSELTGPGAWVLWVLLAALAVAIVAPPRVRTGLPALVVGACVAIAAIVRMPALLHPQLVEAGDYETRELYHWAREHTPVDAVFLTPPDLGGFRLLARRAIYVDFKSPPLVPDELIEWYRRLCLVTGVDALIVKPDMRARWNATSATELFARARALGTDYVVIDKPVELPIAPVFHNAGYSVYAVSAIRN
jgi:hypothetical protein